jgi:hypothetical protein
VGMSSRLKNYYKRKWVFSLMIKRFHS